MLNITVMPKINKHNRGDLILGVIHLNLWKKKKKEVKATRFGNSWSGSVWRYRSIRWQLIRMEEGDSLLHSAIHVTGPVLLSAVLEAVSPSRIYDSEHELRCHGWNSRARCWEISLRFMQMGFLQECLREMLIKCAWTGKQEPQEDTLWMTVLTT